MKFELNRYHNTHTKVNKVKRLLWDIVWLLFARFTPRWCLNNWRSNLLRMFGARIGKGCKINGNVRIWLPDNLAIGDNCWIDEGVRLYCVDKIEIGNDCVISVDAFLCTASHDVASPCFSLVSRPITLSNAVWLAGKAIVLPGVTIGDGAVVGAGAVVCDDIPPWTVVGGNPAKIIAGRKIQDES